MNRKELKGIRSQKLEESIREWQPWKGEMDHGMSIIINTMPNINEKCESEKMNRKS